MGLNCRNNDKPSSLTRMLSAFMFFILVFVPPVSANPKMRAANVEIGLEALGTGQTEAFKALLDLQKEIESVPAKPTGDEDSTFEVVVDQDQSEQSEQQTSSENDTDVTQAASGQTNPNEAPENAAQSPQPDPSSKTRFTEAAWQYRAVDFHHRKAQEALAKAGEEKDPAMQHYYLSQAEDNKRLAQGAMRKLNQTLEIKTSSTTPDQIGALGHDFKLKGKAWHQLLEISGGPDEKGFKRLELFDNPGAPLPTPPQTQNQKPKVQELFVNPRSRAPAEIVPKSKPEVIQFGNGLQIDIAPIRQAIAVVDRSDSKKALFIECGEILCPSRTLLKYFSTEQLREKLDKVGGVALNVTIDMLEATGISDFRSGGELALVDHPNLVSLKRLHEAVLPYAENDNWADLPENLRFFGNFERIHGYVLDPVSEDIILIGARAKAPHRRIDIDNLILAVRTTYRDELEMSVSLDSPPGFMSGPSTPRFINVPSDSVTAKDMIEADYVMKHMVSAWGPYADQRFMPITDISARHRDEGESAGRFWLNPKRLARDGIYVSVSGKTILFETQVQALSEEAFLRNGRWTYQGTENAIDAALAAEFTNRYSQYEETDEIKPAGIFKRLHGIVDLVTLAKMWRIYQLNYGILHEVAELPYRKLTGSEAIPKTFPELYSWHPTEWGEDGGSAIFGGAVLDIGVSAASLYQAEDPRIEELERLTELFRSGDAIVLETDLLLGLPAGSGPGGRSIKPLLLNGERAYRNGNTSEALSIFKRATESDPTNPEAWAWLSRVHEDAGNLDEAISTIGVAVRFSPWDPGYEQIAFSLLWQKDPEALLANVGETDKQALARLYLEQARREYRNSNNTGTVVSASIAIRLDPSNHEAFYLRGLARYPGTDDLEKALVLKPDSFNTLYHLAVRNQDSSAFEKAITGYSAALELFPGKKGVYLRRARARLGLTSWGKTPTREFGGLGPSKNTLTASSLELARTDYEAALRIDPHYSTAWRELAALHQRMEQNDLALTALDKAIENDPMNALNHLKRAELFRLNGQTDRARGEVEKALRLNPDASTGRLGLGQIYLAEENYQAAKRELEAHISELKWGREMSEAQTLLARTFHLMGNPELAFDAYSDPLSSGYPSMEARIGRAEAAIDLGMYRPALRDLKIAERKYGINLRLLEARASAYAALGQIDQALIVLDDALDLHPSNTRLRQLRTQISKSLKEN